LVHQYAIGVNMIKTGGRADYKNVNLPKELLDQVDEFVRENPIFRSRAEFVKMAIMDKVEKIKFEKQFPEATKWLINDEIKKDLTKSKVLEKTNQDDINFDSSLDDAAENHVVATVVATVVAAAIKSLHDQGLLVQIPENKKDSQLKK